MLRERPANLWLSFADYDRVAVVTHFDHLQQSFHTGFPEVEQGMDAALQYLLHLFLVEVTELRRGYSLDFGQQRPKFHFPSLQERQQQQRKVAFVLFR